MSAWDFWFDEVEREGLARGVRGETPEEASRRCREAKAERLGSVGRTRVAAGIAPGWFSIDLARKALGGER
jgi:hypothetical protein